MVASWTLRHHVPRFHIYAIPLCHTVVSHFHILMVQTWSHAMCHTFFTLAHHALCHRQQHAHDAIPCCATLFPRLLCRSLAPYCCAALHATLLCHQGTMMGHAQCCITMSHHVHFVPLFKYAMRACHALLPLLCQVSHIGRARSASTLNRCN